MALTYQAKQDWMMYFSDPDNWRNVFNESANKKGIDRKSRFFQTIKFNVSDWAKYLNIWHKPAPNFEKAQNLTQLIVAYDFCVEPDLKAYNKLKHNIVSGGITHAPWSDVIEFEGHEVNSPRHFSFSSGCDKFEISTTSDDRNKILAFRSIFNSAQRSDNVSRVDEQELAPYEVIHEMNKGDVVEGVDKTRWLYRNFETPHAGRFIRNLRATFNRDLRLSLPSFFALTYDQSMGLAAVRADEFESLDLGKTQKTLDMINNAIQKYGLE